MVLLFTPTIFLEIAVFILAVIAFALAVRFFIASRRTLKGMLPGREQKRAHFGVEIDRDGFIVPAAKQRPAAPPASGRVTDEEARQEMKELRNMLHVQQLELARALRQIESLHTVKKIGDDYGEADEYEEPFSGADDSLAAAELRQQLARKEEEAAELRQEVELSRKLEAHFERMESDYNDLQEKVQEMEGKSWQSAELAAKLEGLEEALEKAQSETQKKEARIRELMAENNGLQQRVAQAEDRLGEAASQRHQLVKQAQFLEQINADAQQMSDANRKLRTELRRVAELESMLNLITEERDVLLKRKRV